MPSNLIRTIFFRFKGVIYIHCVFLIALTFSYTDFSFLPLSQQRQNVACRQFYFPSSIKYISPCYRQHHSSTLSRFSSSDKDQNSLEPNDPPSSNESVSQTQTLSRIQLRRQQRAQSVNKKKVLSKGDRILDDFMGKRMGKGTAFYGESLSKLSDEEYLERTRDAQERRNNENPSLRSNSGDETEVSESIDEDSDKEREVVASRLTSDISSSGLSSTSTGGPAFSQSISTPSGSSNPFETLANQPLRENAVLVVGATGETGRWIMTDLLSKGFNVRLLVRNLAKAESLFGPDGGNCDIFEGDVNDLNSVREACSGAMAIIYCAGGRVSDGGFLGNSGNVFKEVDYEGVKNMVQAAEESGIDFNNPKKNYNLEKPKPSVQKIILLSSIGVTNPERQKYTNPLENFLQGNILKEKLKWKFDGEEALRKSSIEYVIVRAGKLDEPDGYSRGIEVDTGDRWEINNSYVSRVDAAAAVVQSLTQDVGNITFEVRNNEEIRRSPGYLDERDMKTIALQSLEQDSEEEKYWEDLLNTL